MDNKEKYMISDDALSNVIGGTEIRSDDPQLLGPKCPYCFLQMSRKDAGYHCDKCGRDFDLNLKEVTNKSSANNRAC